MSQVQEYHLKMDGNDLSWFTDHVGTHRCFPASLQVGGQCWPVWIGYRGRFSRRQVKPSYQLWFHEPSPLPGHASLHLTAAARDPSLLRGRLALELFNDLGVPAPRAWHVSLTLEGQPMGLYTAIESLDAAWFRRQGLPDGAIYYAVGRQGTFGLIDPETRTKKKYPVAGYEKCHPWDDDFSDLEQLIYQITLPPDAEFETQIATVLDVECYLRWLAGIVFMSHTDGLVQNYALFRSQGGRWQISPWDCDGTWGRVPGGGRLPADYLPLLGGNYLSFRLLTSSRWRRRYLEIWDELLAGPLGRVHVSARLAAIYTAIRKPALKDPLKPYRNSTFLREPALIRRYVTQRTEVIQRELADWRTGVIPVRAGFRGV